MRWSELNSRRLAEVSRDAICLLPLGAIEQHGPHLALATDQIIAESMAHRVDEAFAGEILVLPGLAATCSEHHMAFSGTLTLQHETFMHVVMEILQSASRHGFWRFFMLNAHGGNMAVGGVIAEKAAIRLPECEIVFSTWFRSASDRLRPLVTGGYPAVGHACEFETSLMLALRPDLVDQEAIMDDGIAPTSSLLQADLLAAGPTARSMRFDRISKCGVWGKPSLATAEKGQAILDIVISTYRELFEAYWPDAPGVTCPSSSTSGQEKSIEAFNRRANR